MHLCQFLRRSARIAPDAVAVSDPGGAMTWAAFEDRVARLAGGLRALGIGDGTRVAFLVAPGRDAMLLYFAPIWAGAITVPLNLRWSEAELTAALEDIAPEVLVVDADHAARGCAAAARVPTIRHLVTTGSAADGLLALADVAAAAPVAARGDGGDAVAALFFTSGTTGRARAVMLSHANIWLNSMCSATFLGLTDRAVLLHVQPLFHLAGGARAFSSVMTGALQVFLPRFDPSAILETIPRVAATHIGLVPTMLSMLLDHPDCAAADLSSLRVVGYGAAPMTVPLLRRAMERLPNAGFVNSYGMTELSPLATCLGIEDHREALRGRPDLLRSVGRPVWNVEIRLCDAAGVQMPDGTPGEIMVRGPTVMRGYWGAGADETPLRDGWLATGDIGVFEPGGYLRLIDRKKDIIISGGENVASLEVETVLADHPDVVECAVIGRPDDAWGERVHAVVVVRGAAMPFEASTLEMHCRATLASYKCPKSWDIGTAPLPRTAIGKIDKKALRQ